VLEVVEQPLVLQQPLDEVQIAFAVLGDVAVRLERFAQAELEGEQGAIGCENLGDGLLDGQVLEQAQIVAVAEHRCGKSIFIFRAYVKLAE